MKKAFEEFKQDSLKLRENMTDPAERDSVIQILEE